MPRLSRSAQISASPDQAGVPALGASTEDALNVNVLLAGQQPAPAIQRDPGMQLVTFFGLTLLIAIVVIVAVKLLKRMK